jgi:GDPmannose 4,6-dehydratase
MGIGKIMRGETDRLVMGNIDSQRDWGHAKDYVEGMWKILQHDTPSDFVLATGKMYSVRLFIEKAFELRGINIAWKNSGVDEIGYDVNTGKEYVFIDEKYFRPAEVELLIGDATKAKTTLAWEPKIEFEELVRRMMDHDCPM